MRIKELEQQIQDLKLLHNKKIKALKDKQNVQNVQNVQNLQNGTNNIQNKTDSQQKEVNALKVRLNQKQAMIDNLQMTIDTQQESVNDLKTQISLLQIQLSQSNRIAADEDKSNRIDKSSETMHDSKQDEIQNHDDCKEQYIEKEKLYMEKIKILEIDITEYKRQIEILQEKLNLEISKGEQSVKAVHNELEWSKLEQQKNQQLISKLQFELNAAKNAPSYVEYETLLLQLEKIEKRGNEREKELEQAYLRLLQTNDDIEEKLTQKHETQIKAKNEQIRSLQNELSVLMTAFEKIQSK